MCKDTQNVPSKNQSPGKAFGRKMGLSSESQKGVPWEQDRPRVAWLWRVAHPILAWPPSGPHGKQVVSRPW